MQHVEKHVRASGLWLTAVSPILYAAAQLIAAPLYPRYDWTTQLASELGAAGTASAAVFNPAIVLSGLATLAGAVGFKLGLRCTGGSRVVPWLICASLLSSGSASIWAGVHPLPAPMHDPGYWGIGTVAFPFLLAVALWRSPVSRVTRLYLAATVICVAGFLVLSTGVTGLDTTAYRGALQRLGAFLVYAPMTIGAIIVMRLGRAGQ